MDESEAVGAFEHLGLTSYEAKVFIALQRIGSGTARDVSRATDVPRSQVYSAAESLAERGLVDVQQSNPMEYRPVSVESAKSTLRDRLIREQERAFEYVESVRADREDEQREDIWTIRGQEGVGDRIVELIAEADQRIVFGAPSPELVTDAIAAGIQERTGDGLSVTVISESEAVRDMFREDDVTILEPPAMLATNERTGRLLFADHDIFLVSVLDPERGPEGATAVWSAHTNFASAMIQLVEISLGVV